MIYLKFNQPHNSKRRKLMKKRIIAIVCLVALLCSMASFSASALAGWTTYNAPSDVDYSFVAIGDMQSMTWTDNKQGTKHVKSIFDWILQNKSSRKIEYVFGLGDTIDTLTTYGTNKPEANGKKQNVNEWILVSEQIHRLDGVIPYSIVRGNHDDEGGYHKYICTDAYKEQMDGFFYDSSKPATLGNSMSNHYNKITIGNTKYLMLSIDYGADSKVMAWANEVISSNPDYRVIVSVHAYLDGGYSGGVGAYYGFYSGSIGAANHTNSYQQNTPFNGEDLWNGIFSKHENMFMVLCGHDAIPTPVHNVRTGKNGTKVIEILTDTSKYDLEKDGNNYGSGLAMVINFREDTNEIQIEYLSPEKALKGNTSYHLAGEQISFTYEDLGVSTAEAPATPVINKQASIRISEVKPGLRFTTTFSEAEVNSLVNTYGADNVKIGTLIAPQNALAGKPLTHAFGTSGVNYLDIEATIDKPYASGDGKLTYAGTISNIKQKNLTTEFTAVGYIAYRKNESSAWTYVYSESSAIKNAYRVAILALADKDAGYSSVEKEIITKLTEK